METTRVLLLRIPPRLADIIRTLGEPKDGLEVVVRHGGTESPLAAAAASEADVVVMALDDPEVPDSWRELLATRPRTRLLALVDDGRTATFWELRPHHETLRDLGPDAFFAALRPPEWTRHAIAAR